MGAGLPLAPLGLSGCRDRINLDQGSLEDGEVIRFLVGFDVHINGVVVVLLGLVEGLILSNNSHQKIPDPVVDFG